MEKAAPSIFIGNGINIALNKLCHDVEVKLDYDSIFNKVIEQLPNHPKLCAFLKKAKSRDLEYLLLILKNSDECFKYATEYYCDLTPDCFDLINKHKKLLKETVVEILTNDNFHPSYEVIFRNDDYKPYIVKCGRNLKEFDRIFTINYDLILYWLLNDQKLLRDQFFRDGFSPNPKTRFFDNKGNEIKNLYGISLNNNRPNYFYLHGALHLIQKNNRTYKIVKSKDDGFLRLADIKDILLEKHPDLDSLIIFSATSDEKISSIISNSYLNKMYDKITPIDGDIVIYGCNFLNKEQKIDLGNDIHLWQKIVNSNTKNIYVSIGERGKDLLNHFAKELKDQLSRYKFKEHINISVHCFSHEQIDIWKSDHFYSDIKRNSSDSYFIGD